MTEIVIGGVSLSVAIIILVEAAKRAGLPSNWQPVVAILLGVALAELHALGRGASSLEALVVAAVQGIISGAVAVGLYSGVKNTFKDRG